MTDRLAFVVEDGPAAAYPARFNLRPSLDHRTGSGLQLRLDLAAEAVGVVQADLGLRPLAGP
jgi:hypothetical protein